MAEDLIDVQGARSLRLSALSSAAWAYSTKNALMLPERREGIRKTFGQYF